jgi:hypothetical protein
MDISLTDILFIVVVLWMVIELLNNSDWGSGHRARKNDRAAVPVGCAA